MKKTTLNLLAALLFTSGGGFALTPTEWQHTQTVAVAEPGLTKITLPPATWDSAQPGLADLRLLDPSGQEVPYILDRGLASNAPTFAKAPAAHSFSSTRTGETTQLLIETGAAGPIEAIDLETPAPFFLKAAHVEISADGKAWESLGPAIPVFRQFGAEQLRLPLDHRTAAFVRVTLDDFRSRKVDFSGARLLLSPAETAPPILSPLRTQITRRDEFAGETVLTVTLEASHIPLAELALDVKDPLFMRRVDLAVREASGATPSERLIGKGTIFRLAFDGTPTRSQLAVPVDFSPATREFLVHIRNGDSPPLKIEGVQASQYPVSLLFHAAAAGRFTLLSGNPQATTPSYDLAAFAGEMQTAHAAPAMPGPLEETPGYRPSESLAAPSQPDVPLTGAPLDTQAWTGRQPIEITRPGVQELELDVEALSRACPDGADLRVIREKKQIPYVLERPALSRSISLKPLVVADPKRPGTSVWMLKLPQPGLPIRRIQLSTSTPLFQRQLRLFEKRTTPEGLPVEVLLASGPWSRMPDPGVPETIEFPLADRLHGDTIWIETENGDNPPIELSAAQAIYPVMRLIFKVAETDGFTLAYGNKAAKAPRYDLSLVAVKLLTSSRNSARLVPSGQAAPEPQNHFDSINGGFLFWAALTIVVVTLLVVVAKLLPKPPEE